MQTKRKDIFWKVAVVLLFVFVLIQSTVLYFVLYKPMATQNAVSVEKADAVIVPRGYRVTHSSRPLQQGNYSTARTVTPQTQSNLLSNAGNQKCSLNNSCTNILPPLPQVPIQQQVSQSSPIISQGLSGQGQQITPNSTMTLGTGSLTGIMQAMMNDPFFEDDSFFGNMGEEVARMQELMEAMFPQGNMQTSTNMHNGRLSLNNSINLKDDGNNYVFEMKISGLDKSDIKAEVNKGILTISGTKKQQVQNNSQYGGTYSSSYSSFQNSFMLPGKVDAQNIKVDYNNNILKVILPKV
jgi:HSP20 family protein